MRERDDVSKRENEKAHVKKIYIYIKGEEKQTKHGVGCLPD
jgi:hypothetical protein